MKTKTIVGVDGNWILHRAYFTTPDHVQDRGRVICKKFVSMVCKDALANKATEILVAFDGARIFRYKLYPEYKANRGGDHDSTPYDYLEGLQAYLGELGIASLQVTQYEADDILCSLAHNVAASSTGPTYTVMLAKDKDAYQYIGERVFLYDSSAKPEPKFIKAWDVERRMGLHPSQCLDYQTLVGDKIDNIPQLVSPAKALQGLQQWGTLKAWLKGDPVLRKNLSERKDELTLNRKLVSLVADIEKAVPRKPVWADNTEVTSYVQWKDFCNPKSKGLF